MKRNQISHFSQAPNVAVQRSVFDLSFGRHTSFDAGKLYPIFHMEVLPGDTIHLDASMVTRMQTPIFPVMDNCYLDTFFFFVPNRLVWNNWKQFMGENNSSAWEDNVDYTVPQVNISGQRALESGSLGDHFGLPLGVYFSADALPFRAYRLIWNEWFRNQNYQAPKLLNLGNAEDQQIAKDEPYPVNRFRDYFSSALPSPQKGGSVQIPLTGSAPVVTGADLSGAQISDLTSIGFANRGIHWFTSPQAGDVPDSLMMLDGAGNAGGNKTFNTTLLASFDGNVVSGSPRPLNLHAIFDAGSGYATVNALRQAFQIQRILEKDARSGTRYVEILRSHFGVIAPDASLQRPEYLGGRRITLNIDQVLQTSSTDETSPLGQTGAFSKTIDNSEIFRKSFTEHGRIIGVCCVRTDRSYQQGIPREFMRKHRFDYYFPALAHLGEQAVKAQEIYAAADPDRVFGYQEAWAEYRTRPNQVTGAFRTDYVGGTGFNAWHYADWYQTSPVASDAWQREGKERLARTLVVQDGPIDSQFIADIWYTVTAARPMPLYSVPGLIDHF